MITRSRRALALHILVCAAILRAVPAFGACDPVGKLEFGPFDYRAAPPDKLHIVEAYHFNADVEQLRKGQSTTNIGEDLEFVLRYFPNHSRALNSMMKLGKREKTDKPRGNRDSIECWFERATKFVPGDGTVNLLYALWLVHAGKKSEATEQLALARGGDSNNANYAYNLGLGFLEVGDYESALEFAHKAYALGYPLPGLRDRLIRAKKWRDAVPPASTAEASTGAAPSVVPLPERHNAAEPNGAKGPGR